MTKFMRGEKVRVNLIHSNYDGKIGTVLLHDGTDFMPYRVGFDNGYGLFEEDYEWFDESHLEAVDEPTPKTKGMFIVVRENNLSHPVPSTYPKVHNNLEDAQTEAERLARGNQGKSFAVYRRVSTSVLPKKVVTTVNT